MRPIDDMVVGQDQPLVQTKGSKWLDFHIFNRMPMDQAIQRQRAIIDAILPVLVDLARVYKQAVRIEQPTLRTTPR